MRCSSMKAYNSSVFLALTPSPIQKIQASHFHLRAFFMLFGYSTNRNCVFSHLMWYKSQQWGFQRLCRTAVPTSMFWRSLNWHAASAYTYIYVYNAKQKIFYIHINVLYLKLLFHMLGYRFHHECAHLWNAKNIFNVNIPGASEMRFNYKMPFLLHIHTHIHTAQLLSLLVVQNKLTVHMYITAIHRLISTILATKMSYFFQIGNIQKKQHEIDDSEREKEIYSACEQQNINWRVCENNLHVGWLLLSQIMLKLFERWARVYTRKLPPKNKHKRVDTVINVDMGEK